MSRFAFISKHVPTERHLGIAAKQNVILVYVGEKNPFSVDPTWLITHRDGPFDGVVVTHPAAAMRLAEDFLIGVFQDVERFFIYDRRC